jgi:UDP-N-acetyl-D-galactosamine dehydrogenase
LAPSIKVAEAAKVIENSQRDINIAFVNELAKIFNLMNIDTHAVWLRPPNGIFCLSSQG